MTRSFWFRTLGVFLTAFVIFGLGSPQAWAAQQRGDVWSELGESFHGAPADSSESTLTGNTYVLPESGAEVVLADGLEPEGSDFEDQIIVNTPQGMGAIAVLTGFGTPESVLETYANAFGDSLDGSSEIYLESNSEFASGLYAFEMIGLPMLMYITVDAVATPGYLTIEVAIAEADISGAIVTMRDHVAINGVPMFDGVDELEVQNRADDYLGT